MTKAETVKKMTDLMRVQRKSERTIQVYLEWLHKYMMFLPTCSDAPHEEKISRFLSRQVNTFHVSAATQKQALCALVYLYKQVLNLDVGTLDFLRSKRTPRLPEVLNRAEAWRLLDQLSGVPWLWGALMYGCGLRLSEVCALRIKDVDFDRRTLMVRQGKGGKDRMVPLPDLLAEPLRNRQAELSQSHATFAAAGIGVALPDALERKYPAAPTSWAWFWYFPATAPPADSQWCGRLWHVHPSAIQKRLHQAFVTAHIPKKAGCHTLRHSFATHWLENAEGSHEIAIKKLQEILGHRDVRTTMIYLHLLPGVGQVNSPLDLRPP